MKIGGHYSTSHRWALVESNLAVPPSRNLDDGIVDRQADHRCCCRHDISSCTRTLATAASPDRGVPRLQDLSSRARRPAFIAQGAITSLGSLIQAAPGSAGGRSGSPTKRLKSAGIPLPTPSGEVPGMGVRTAKKRAALPKTLGQTVGFPHDREPAGGGGPPTLSPLFHCWTR